MGNLLENIQETLLMGPGPSNVHPTVYKAIAKPTIGHLDPYFIEIMDEIKYMLQQLLQTKNQLTIPISGTGSAGMETVFVNLIESGDPVLILKNGVFGNRMQDIATRLHAQVDTLEFNWGSPIDIDAIKTKLISKQYKLVAVVHAETSTGVYNPIASLGSLVKENGALFVVDAVTSLGGMPVKTDAWHIDAIYSGTQKCLSVPPGLAPVSFSDDAVKVIQHRKTKVPNWYLDLNMIIDYWQGSKRAYHHTAPINMLYALYASLSLILDEGLEVIYKRHLKVHQRLISGLNELGLHMLVDEPYRLPMLNAVLVPEGIDEAEVRMKLLNDYHIEIGAGLGPLAGKIWRIGLMGHTAYPQNVDRFFHILNKVI